MGVDIGVCSHGHSPTKPAAEIGPEIWKQQLFYSSPHLGCCDGITRRDLAANEHCRVHYAASAPWCATRRSSCRSAQSLPTQGAFLHRGFFPLLELGINCSNQSPPLSPPLTQKAARMCSRWSFTQTSTRTRRRKHGLRKSLWRSDKPMKDSWLTLYDSDIPLDPLRHISY